MKHTQSTVTTFKLIAIILFFALPAVLGAYLYVSSSDGSASAASGPAAAPARPAALKEVAHDAGSFSDGQAQFFGYETPDGSSITYFVVQGQDGLIRAALDACKECWQKGKGHYQQGGAMVCRECDKQFPIDSIGNATSDCSPVPLTVSRTSKKVVIDPKSLMEATEYFAQTGGGIGGSQCGGAGCGGCGGGGTPTRSKGGCC